MQVEARRSASLRALAGAARRRVQLELDLAQARVVQADIGLFHDFLPSPAGGAHQTLRAIVGEMRRRGVRVAVDSIPRGAEACLFNSFNFDPERLARFADRLPTGCRMVHRVGAVTTLYRGVDDGTDARVADLNARFADATIAISHATVAMYMSIGIELVDPHVIYNGVDSAIFNAEGRVSFDRSRKTRLVAVSWSDNANKGGPMLRWLEDVLDPEQYELTFVGNTREAFERVRVLPPLPSAELAELLRGQDIYVTGTRHDAYSNALVEALSCGLPAVYLDSGGSREAVKEAGFGFHEREEIPELLHRLREEYEVRQASISLPSLEQVVDDYLGVLGLHRFIGADRGRS